MKTYSPGDIVLTVHDNRITGFAKGTFVKVERDTESFKDDAGAQGDVVVVQMLDRRGKITITLQNESPSNDVLSTIVRNGERFGLTSKPSQVQNLGGTTIHHAGDSWVEKPADQEYADDAGTTEWVIRCADLDMFTGGAS